MPKTNMQTAPTIKPVRMFLRARRRVIMGEEEYRAPPGGGGRRRAPCASNWGRRLAAAGKPRAPCAPSGRRLAAAGGGALHAPRIGGAAWRRRVNRALHALHQ